MYNRCATTYQNTNITTTDPNRLITMLYDAAIKNLLLAREGILKKDVTMRGEHLGKAISIITELLSSVQGDPEEEAVAFLRGLYSSMLKELIKVNIHNKTKPVELSIKYIAQLKDIWQKQVIQGSEKNRQEKNKPESASLDKYDRSAIKNTKDSGRVNQAYQAGFMCRG